ncbi:MAG: tyrosine-type recombinase/integrase [Candidatus Acidiferrales bacterium]
MAQSKFTLYKYVKLGDCSWRYKKAAFYSNGKIKPNVVVTGKNAQGKPIEEMHAEGSYKMNHNGTWLDASADALEAQRQRNARLDHEEFQRLRGTAPAPSPTMQPTFDRLTLSAAAEKYFSNCEKRGLDSKTVRKYRAAVEPFIQHCGVTYVDECRENKQPLLDYMGWLRKQPVPKRKNGNPERTLANKVEDVRIFLKEFGVTKLLKKNEEPRYHEKKVVAHTDDELGVLYGHANAEDIFLLDFFIGTMARDHEGYRCRYRDLTATTLILYGKHHKTRTVEISQRLADTINDRRKRKKADYDDLLFANRNGKPDQHLLRRLQRIPKRAGVKFHTELNKLRKTGASRRYLAGVPLPTLMLELGHESLATTQKYLADVRKPGEAKKAVADADFVPTPKTVKKTGTDDD